MSYRVTYGQLGNEQDVYNPAAGVYLVSGGADFEANVSAVLELELPPNHPLLGEMEPMSTSMEIRLYDGDVELMRGRITSDGDDLNRIGHVKVEDQQAYLNDVNCRPYATYYVDDQKDQLPIISGNLAQHLIEDYNAHCSAGRQFSFLGSEVGDDMRVSTTDPQTIRDELADTIYDAGAFVVVGSVDEARTIQFFRDPPKGDQVIRVAENMLSYEHERDYTGIVTAIIAKGKGSRSEAETNDAAHEEEFGLETLQSGDYGAIRIDGDRAISVEGEKKYGIIEDTRSYECATPQGLFELVERDLENAVAEVRSVDVDAYDLHQMNPDIKPLRLCHVYTIESPAGTFDMMLTEYHLDICDPSKSTYHFGRLASSLSRTGVAESAAGRASQRDTVYNANRDHIDNAQDHKHLIDGLGEIGDGIIDLTQDFNTEIDGLRDLVDAGTEQAGERIDQLEETLGGRIGDLDEALGRTEKRIDGVEGRSEELDAAIQSAAQQAMSALYSSVYYGTCSTNMSTATKVVSNAVSQNGEPFKLQKGVMVIVSFSQGNSAARPTLNINSTGARPIAINGTNTCYWGDGQTAGFIYDGSNWTTPSSSVWAAMALVGNPLGFNFYTDGSKVALRYGDQEYIKANGSGIQVGMTAVGTGEGAVGTRNLYLGSSKFALRQGQTDYLTLTDSGIQVGMNGWKNVYIGSSTLEMRSPNSKQPPLKFDWESTYDAANISGDNGVVISSDYGFMSFGNRYGGVSVDTFGQGPTLTCKTAATSSTGSLAFGVGPRGYTTNLRQWIMTSLVVQGTGQTYVSIPASRLGVRDLAGYAFAVTNGDEAANDIFVTGTELTNGTLWVSFSAPNNYPTRLNILGVPVGVVSTSNDPGAEGPEIFDDQNNDSDQEAA